MTRGLGRRRGLAHQSSQSRVRKFSHDSIAPGLQETLDKTQNFLILSQLMLPSNELAEPEVSLVTDKFGDQEAVKTARPVESLSSLKWHKKNSPSGSARARGVVPL